MNTARMTYWTTENFVCGIFSSRPDIPVTIYRPAATNQNPFSFCLGSLFRVPQIGHACCKTKTSRQLRKDYTSLKANWVASRLRTCASYPRCLDRNSGRMPNVIHPLERPDAPQKTLRGKRAQEKAPQPQARKLSMGRPVRGCHPPFQKAPGLDQEISRKAFSRPCPQLRPSTDRSRPVCRPTMIPRPSL